MQTNRMSRWNSMAGFSLVDVMATILVMGITMGVAVPAFQGATGSTAVGRAAIEVERELQNARHKAVTSNRTMRVRFNCPTVGRYRTVELIGRPSQPAAEDLGTDRCSEGAYPYPAADSDPQTLPNHDGAEHALPEGLSFGQSATLEFWPDGSVHVEHDVTAPWPVASASGELVTIKQDDRAQVITVTGVGRIRVQQ